MAVLVTLYAPKKKRLPLKEIRRLAEGGTVEGGPAGCRVAFGGLSVTFTPVPDDDFGDHLLSFGLGLRRLIQGELNERQEAAFDRVSRSQAAVEVAIDPGFDKAGRAARVLEGVARHLGAMVFNGHLLYDEEGRFLLGPSVKLPDEGERPPPTPRQQRRAERSREQLRKRQAPLYKGALFVDDDEEAVVRSPEEVARRTLALWAVAIRGDGAPAEVARGVMDAADNWGAASAEERAFLENDGPSPQERGSFVWRLECIEVLLWALGHHAELAWPAGFCDVPRLAAIMRRAEGEAAFIREATLRPVAELLDAQDLTLRQHWAIRQCYLDSEPIPEDLDWSGKAERKDVRGCPVTGVVAERHRALNWLLCFGGEDDWDRVDTPT
jgi:hypothetical protein